MPIRTQPKIHMLHLKTHKLSIQLTALPQTTVGALKVDALDALSSGILPDSAFPGSHEYGESAMLLDEWSDEQIPRPKSVDHFELCRAVKERDRSTGAYETLDPMRTVRDYGCPVWEVLYIQFRDGSGELMPVMCTLPSVDDDDVPGQPQEETGKRKAVPDE